MRNFNQYFVQYLWGGVGVEWSGVVWCGVVWCGVVWCGVVWCGVVWCGVVWCGVVWCGVVCGIYGVVWYGYWLVKVITFTLSRHLVMYINSNV